MIQKSGPLLFIPKPQITKNSYLKQIKPTRYLHLSWNVLVSDELTTELADRYIFKIIDPVHSRTNKFLVSRCGINLYPSPSPGVSFYRCGTTRNCITQLSETGNASMAAFIENESISPPQTYNGHPLVNVILVPQAKFTDNPTLLGTTVTYGTTKNYSLYIWLTSHAMQKANPWILAHEIGHALLTRKNKIPEHDVKDPSNLMHAPVPRFSDPLKVKLTPLQKKSFRNSPLLS
ncbi:hypothetical protein [Paenibacillus sp. Y412MC10]|uniref:hypothetical protein n=1 Tax=Geobacillus sp. (strain Y412MC10) TaxID=481743 RepID=UPI0011A4B8B8|nr:hypothetical protein [Paenibacillus sp. Y412MC10]